MLPNKAGVGYPCWAMGAAVGDYNNDGPPDLPVTCLNGVVRCRNNGDGTFTDATKESGLVSDTGWAMGAAFGDYDNDGFADLFVSHYVDVQLDHLPVFGTTKACKYLGLVQCGPRGLRGLPDRLYHNNGNGTFTEVTKRAGVDDAEGRYGLTSFWSDFNNCGKLDLFVASDGEANYLFERLAISPMLASAPRRGKTCFAMSAKCNFLSDVIVGVGTDGVFYPDRSSGLDRRLPGAPREPLLPFRRYRLFRWQLRNIPSAAQRLDELDTACHLLDAQHDDRLLICEQSRLCGKYIQVGIKPSFIPRGRNINISLRRCDGLLLLLYLLREEAQGDKRILRLLKCRQNRLFVTCNICIIEGRILRHCRLPQSAIEYRF